MAENRHKKESRMAQEILIAAAAAGAVLLPWLMPMLDEDIWEKYRTEDWGGTPLQRRPCCPFRNGA